MQHILYESAGGFAVNNDCQRLYQDSRFHVCHYGHRVTWLWRGEFTDPKIILICINERDVHKQMKFLSGYA